MGSRGEADRLSLGELPPDARRAVERKRAMKRGWIYCDVDNTLTIEDVPCAEPRVEVIRKLKAAIKKGWKVVLWSACGQEYCREFAKKHDIQGLEACLSKPWRIVDDNKEIRSHRHCPRLYPDEFLEMKL
jgi:hypothetical protein